MLLVASVNVMGVSPASDDCSVDVVGSISLQRGPSHTHVKYGTHVVDGGQYSDEREVVDGWKIWFVHRGRLNIFHRENVTYF